jgi:hypothetical protein
MMMQYHFGLGVGHTYANYHYSDSSGASDTRHGDEDNNCDIDNHLHPDNPTDVGSDLGSDSTSRLSFGLEDNDEEYGDDDEFLALHEMYD